MLISNEIHYIAGLLEGEGTFYMNNTPIIQLGMTDFDVVKRVGDIMSRKRPVHINISKKSSYKDMYVFTIGSSEAIQWMMTLYPLMGTRRKEKIREIIKKWKTIQSKRININICRFGHSNLIINKDYKYDNRGTKICLYCKRKRDGFRIPTRVAL